MVTLWLALVATTIMTGRIDVTNFGVLFWDLNGEGAAAYTDWDAKWEKKTPNGHYLTGVQSYHDNGRE